LLELRGVADGWRSFASGPIDVGALQPGSWRFDVEILRRGGHGGGLTTIGRRTAAIAQIRHGNPAFVTAFAMAAAFAALFVLSGTRWRWLAAALAAACSVLALLS
jgi:hypothetical protein